MQQLPSLVVGPVLEYVLLGIGEEVEIVDCGLFVVVAAAVVIVVAGSRFRLWKKAKEEMRGG